MYISELGRRTKASPKAIRLYESLGLLGKVGRKGTYRVYSEQNLQQVRLIRQVQALGFKLAEMGPLLVAVQGTPDWAQLLVVVEQRRAQVAAEVARLQELERALGAVGAEIGACLAAPLPSTLADCVDEVLDSAPWDKLHTS
ncbi:MerR family transcriptional regulator [Massilia rubra]|uniref:MerR family DNA-binding protein n=1 Tax=Massilia rubra TaxID=2607910 RepID=A0ABX0LLF9_9BURK|nr:MerR family transcriptional regulator [Massilia rubra]NHZ35696.1 MerR family DNA-binding protein [Massilia rubra]